MSSTAPEMLAGYQFDLHARYTTLAEILKAALPGSGEHRILDVGAGPSRLTEAFLPAGFADVVRTDVGGFDDPTIVTVAPGSPLPFKNGAFDAVVAMDVLEHVLPEQRAAFVRECIRVGERLTVIAAPIGAPSVQDAERAYIEAFDYVSGAKEAFLEEHASLGLPKSDDVLRMIEDAGALAISVDNVRLDDWLALNVINLFLSTVNDGDAIRTSAARLHNEAFSPRVSGAQHYRRFYICTRDRDLAARLAKSFDPTGSPVGARQSEALLIVADQFKQYAARYHGPTIEALIEDHAQTIKTLQEVIETKDHHIAKQADALQHSATLATILEGLHEIKVRGAQAQHEQGVIQNQYTHLSRVAEESLRTSNDALRTSNEALSTSNDALQAALLLIEEHRANSILYRLRRLYRRARARLGRTEGL
jgi:SAM-dependent methyltransferase